MLFICYNFIRYDNSFVSLPVCRSCLDLQYLAESYSHTMSCLDSAMYHPLTLTEPVASHDRHEGPVHLGDKSLFQTLLSTAEVSEPSHHFLSLALALPVVNTTAVPNVQTVPRASIGRGTVTRQEGLEKAVKETEAHEEAEKCSDSNPPLTNFHAFGNLPPELRIKIWRLSFLPRVVELHPTTTAVQDDDSEQQQQQWQSGCSNPAALSVCSEAREIALKHFRIAYPLASITTQQEFKICTDPLSCTSFKEKAWLRRRILYISPEYDIVAILGQHMDPTKLSSLLDSFRDADLKNIGISNLGLSTSGQDHNEPVGRNFDTTILKDLNQLVLLTNGELMPPSEWSSRSVGSDEQSLACFRKMGNRCELVSCRSSNAWYVYKQWMKGKGRQFWDSQRRILQVGKNRIRIQDLEFETGW